eukprot:TRINITY_DN3787_c0_g1_i1.p1 TRINITY_DN3787_c0_g1~~TRINITY_DN3787_c0_g1_i1.p1  ORF type:complete len:307 (+),score=23.83 TRINITY_DN3787_c0_g1_i1:84-1004(+)
MVLWIPFLVRHQQHCSNFLLCNGVVQHMLRIQRTKILQLVVPEVNYLQKAYQHSGNNESQPSAWKKVINMLDLGRFVEDTKIGVGQGKHDAKWFEIWKVRRGYHPLQDRGEFTYTRGKVFWGHPYPLQPKDSAKFPDVQVVGSEFQKIQFPPQQPSYKMALVTAVVRKTAGSMVAEWEHEFGKMFTGQPGVVMFRMEVCDNSLMSIYPFNRMLVDNIKQQYIRKDPEHDVPINFMFHFGHTNQLREELRMSNIFTAFVYLLDSQNRIRWKACGHPSQMELGYLEKVGNSLLSRRKRRLEREQLQEQ